MSIEKSSCSHIQIMIVVCLYSFKNNIRFIGNEEILIFESFFNNFYSDYTIYKKWHFIKALLSLIFIRLDIENTENSNIINLLCIMPDEFLDF